MGFLPHLTSLAVRSDITMQHETVPERCGHFHILALHFERDFPGFSIVLEESK
ncbi:hypothetical protein BC827DRAFT_1219634 [Russula dissimulans]|nr:hypothetical protein BC827DRAFT_1219634 [Russula dissimulans]